MPHWWKNFSWEWLFDNIAARSPTFVKIMVVTGKSFFYYHGTTRAAALTYTTLVAVVPLLIMLTSISLAVGFGTFISDYLPIVLDMLNLDWPTEQIMDIVENAEHIPIGKLGVIGAGGLFVTFILSFGSLETNFNVVWENKTSRTLIRQIKVYTPFLLIGAAFVGMFAGFMKSIPLEIEEAAVIDGCGPLKTFFLVVFPMLKPTMISVGILEIMWVWNDYLLPYLVLDRNLYRTIPIHIQFPTSNGKW